jgi:hypothetical protein
MVARLAVLEPGSAVTQNCDDPRWLGEWKACHWRANLMEENWANCRHIERNIAV